MRRERTRNTYVGRVYVGHGNYHWVGRFPTRQARDAAVARARVDLESSRSRETVTVDVWTDRYLARYERDHKASSTDKTRTALRRFRDDSATVRCRRSPGLRRWTGWSESRRRRCRA